VLDLLVARSQRYETIFLKGNHEGVMLAGSRRRGLTASGSPANPDAAEQMMLAQRLAEAMPPAHRRFFKTSGGRFVAATFSLFMPASGPAFRCRNRRTKTCSGFGTNFTGAPRDSERLSCTDITRMWNSIPTASTLTPVLCNRAAELPANRTRRFSTSIALRDHMSGHGDYTSSDAWRIWKSYRCINLAR
jgi:hypothetical protein